MKLYENKTEFYLKKFREVHGDRYGYPNIHMKTILNVTAAPPIY